MKMNTTALSPSILETITHALAEDVGEGDVTTNSIVPVEARMSAQIIAKQKGVVAGLDVAAATFRLFDPKVKFIMKVTEGSQVENRKALVEISGNARALLTAERTALNFLGRMSGIATMTNQFVDAIKGTKTVMLDTRKTAPGLRRLDKLAVQRGGGQNHRMGLYDMILIKDNHIDFAGSLSKAVQKARAANQNLKIEIEARTLEDVKIGLELGVEYILLDNMSVEMMHEAVKLNADNAKKAKLEASGNVTLENVRQIAETGVDYISSGALTHSAKVFDLSMLWISK